MLPRPEAKRNGFSSPVVNSPLQPDLVLLIGVKTPHFVYFNADCYVFMGFKVLFVYLFSLVLFFLILL
jgi:hypothetical protein